MRELTEKINTQESKDFKVTKQIFEKILSGNCPHIEATQEGCSVDMRLSAYTKSEMIPMCIEIKERNQNLEIYDKIPITCNKFCNIKAEAREGERILYITLINGEEYYIFDFDKIDWNKVECKHWLIKKTQLDSNSKKKNFPTFFIPISQAIYNGLI